MDQSFKVLSEAIGGKISVPRNGKGSGNGGDQESNVKHGCMVNEQSNANERKNAAVREPLRNSLEERDARNQRHKEGEQQLLIWRKGKRRWASSLGKNEYRTGGHSCMTIKNQTWDRKVSKREKILSQNRFHRL